MQRKYLWFSPLMAKQCGSATFVADNGQTVQATTAIDVDHSHPALKDGLTNPHSGWGDEEFVGIGVEFVDSDFKFTSETDASKSALRKNWGKKKRSSNRKSK